MPGFRRNWWNGGGFEPHGGKVVKGIWCRGRVDVPPVTLGSHGDLCRGSWIGTVRIRRETYKPAVPVFVDVIVMSWHFAIHPAQNPYQWITTTTVVVPRAAGAGRHCKSRLPGHMEHGPGFVCRVRL